MAEIPNLTELFEENKKKAEVYKSPEAWTDLGHAYLYGMGTGQDIEKALDCFRRAAGSYEPRACYAIYEMWTSGVSLILFEEAIENCFRAARQGHEKAAVMVEREKEQIEAAQPKFKYNPNAYVNGTFFKNKYHEEAYDDGNFSLETLDKGKAVCQCCGREIEYFCDIMLSCKEDVNCVCPDCIASGKMAERFNCSYITDAEIESVTDPENIEELYKRTPGNVERWPACCNDFCAFISDYCDNDELERAGVLDEIRKAYRERRSLPPDDDVSTGVGYAITVTLFQCLHCGKYRIWIDWE